MSFKEDARAELLTVLPTKEDEIKAFLSAVCRTAGSIEKSARRLNLVMRLDTYEEGLAVAELFKKVYPIDVELGLPKTNKAGKRFCDVILPMGATRQALTEFELMGVDGESYFSFIEGIPQQLTTEYRCKLAYFKGLFLTCGGVYVPTLGSASEDEDKKKGGYHFELSVEDELFADDIMELLSDLRINTKMSERSEHKLLYVKDKEDILAILALLGLNDCALRLKAIMNERETANSLNRVIICETANLDKIYIASSKHMLAIARLKSTGVYDTLTDALKETADARSEYPEASLNDLSEILGVSKSCLNHRLRKLMELADEC